MLTLSIGVGDVIGSDLLGGGVQHIVEAGDGLPSGLEHGAIVHECSVSSQLVPHLHHSDLAPLLGEEHTVAFVGDGINDAPVLSRADLGIAMGAMGSDAAIEAADVVLMDDHLDRLPKAISISRRTMRIVHENIIFSLAVKGIVLVLSALGLVNMWIAVFADVGVLILAVLNAMRTLRG